MSKNTNKPIAKISLFPVTASIWRNENEGRTSYAVTFERSYRDAAGEWQTSSTFNAHEVLLLAKVADQAHTKLCELRGNDRETQQSDE
jgi:hypothetical protein